MTREPTEEMVRVPREPAEAMWSGLARQIVFWNRGPARTGRQLYIELGLIGMPIPDWLRKEIPDTDHVPPKGTVAVCIYKAMLDSAPIPDEGEIATDGEIANALASSNVHDEMLSPYATIIRRRLENSGLRIVRINPRTSTEWR